MILRGGVSCQGNFLVDITKRSTSCTTSSAPVEREERPIRKSQILDRACSVLRPCKWSQKVDVDSKTSNKQLRSPSSFLSCLRHTLSGVATASSQPW